MKALIATLTVAVCAAMPAIRAEAQSMAPAQPPTSTAQPVAPPAQVGSAPSSVLPTHATGTIEGGAARTRAQAVEQRREQRAAPRSRSEIEPATPTYSARRHETVRNVGRFWPPVF